MEDSKSKRNENIKQKEFEAKHNLVGFFNLLLQIDRRNNPEKYKNPKEKNNYDGYNNYTNSN